MSADCEPARHRLLVRQLRRSAGSDGALDLEKLLGLVSGAYDEHDRDRALDHRAMTVAARELTELNETLLEARDAAEAANLAKTTFLSATSHEIRTPLNGVLGTAAALARTDLGPAQQQMVQVMLDSGKVLRAILNDLLDLAKIESGRLDLETAPFDLCSALRAVTELFRCTAGDKGLDLTLDLAAEPSVWVAGDATRLQQITQNLLSNAIKFTPDGSVRVVARLTPSDADVHVAVEVHDSGIGIAEEARPRLFQRFSQADSGISRRFGGTGLGLALCRDLITAMGGEIDMRPGDAGGSVFFFNLTLPHASSIEPVQTPAGASLSGSDRRLRVLAADDNATNRLVLRTLLESFGIEVVTADDGREAVAAAQSEDFDVVLMDIHMPGMDGIAATRSIRALPGSRGMTPVVAVTAGVSPDEMRSARAAGMTLELPKPIEADALLGILRQAVAERDGQGDQAVADLTPRGTNSRPLEAA